MSYKFEETFCGSLFSRYPTIAQSIKLIKNIQNLSPAALAKEAILLVLSWTASSANQVGQEAAEVASTWCQIIGFITAPVPFLLNWAITKTLNECIDYINAVGWERLTPEQQESTYFKEARAIIEILERLGLNKVADKAADKTGKAIAKNLAANHAEFLGLKPSTEAIKPLEEKQDALKRDEEVTIAELTEIQKESVNADQQKKQAEADAGKAQQDVVATTQVEQAADQNLKKTQSDHDQYSNGRQGIIDAQHNAGAARYKVGDNDWTDDIALAKSQAVAAPPGTKIKFHGHRVDGKAIPYNSAPDLTSAQQSSTTAKNAAESAAANAAQAAEKLQQTVSSQDEVLTKFSKAENKVQQVLRDQSTVGAQLAQAQQAAAADLNQRVGAASFAARIAPLTREQALHDQEDEDAQVAPVQGQDQAVQADPAPGQDQAVQADPAPGQDQTTQSDIQGNVVPASALDAAYAEIEALEQQQAGAAFVAEADALNLSLINTLLDGVDAAMTQQPAAAAVADTSILSENYSASSSKDLLQEVYELREKSQKHLNDLHAALDRLEKLFIDDAFVAAADALDPAAVDTSFDSVEAAMTQQSAAAETTNMSLFDEYSFMSTAGDLQQEIDELREKLDQALSDADASRYEVRNLEEALEENSYVSQELTNGIASLKLENQVHIVKIEELESILSVLDAKNQELTSELMEIRQQENPDAASDSSQQQIARLTEDRAALHEELNIMVVAFQQVQLENDTFQDEKAVLLREITLLRNENADLKRQLIVAQDEIDIATQLLAERDDTIARLRRSRNPSISPNNNIEATATGANDSDIETVRIASPAFFNSTQQVAGAAAAARSTPSPS